MSCECGNRSGHKDLPAVSERSQASTSVHSATVVVTITEVCLASMKSHPHLKWSRKLPVLVMQRHLDPHCRSNGSAGILENRETTIPLTAGSNNCTAMLGYGLFDDRVMSSKCPAHVVAGCFPQPRAVFHIRE